MASIYSMKFLLSAVLQPVWLCGNRTEMSLFLTEKFISGTEQISGKPYFIIVNYISVSLLYTVGCLDYLLYT